MTSQELQTLRETHFGMAEVIEHLLTLDRPSKRSEIARIVAQGLIPQLERPETRLASLALTSAESWHNGNLKAAAREYATECLTLLGRGLPFYVDRNGAVMPTPQTAITLASSRTA